MRNNKNLIAKVILFIILFLGVIFELANHFHLTYIFVNSKLGTLIPAKWVLIISFLGAMFFVCSIVGLGIIGYKVGSWGMALLTVGVSYMSYALIPASINTDVMQIATLEYAVVLPLIVAFTTHELSKFLGLKEITTLTQEQEMQLENMKRTQEFENRKSQLSLAPTPPVQKAKNLPTQTVTEETETVTQTKNPLTETVTPDNYKTVFEKFGLTIDPNNLNFKAQTTETVTKPDIGFKLKNLTTETVTTPTETVVFVQNPTHGNRKQGFQITCQYCGKEAIRYHVGAKYCSDTCKEAYHREGGIKV